MSLLPAALSRRVIAAAKRPMVSAMDASAWTVLDRPVSSAGFEVLDGHSHCLLVTYKRDGGAVPAPVWFAREGSRLYVWTEVNAYKAKRVRRDPRALIAPCGPTGKPLGDPVAARGRVLETDAERAHAARLIESQWTWWQRVFRAMAGPVTDVLYLEFEAVSPT
jgi:PPOX class probable F420-dependent enzyme